MHFICQILPDLSYIAIQRLQRPRRNPQRFQTNNKSILQVSIPIALAKLHLLEAVQGWRGLFFSEWYAVLASAVAQTDDINVRWCKRPAPFVLTYLLDAVLLDSNESLCPPQVYVATH